MKASDATAAAGKPIRSAISGSTGFVNRKCIKETVREKRIIGESSPGKKPANQQDVLSYGLMIRDSQDNEGAHRYPRWALFVD